MPRTVSAKEAKNRLGSLIQWTVSNKDEVIIESRGEPKVVMLPYNEWQTFNEFKELTRRRQALEQLRQLAKGVQARNQDLTPEEADQTADLLVREAVSAMVQEGKIRFEEPQA